MPSIKAMLVMFVTVAVAVAIIFRVSKIRQVVVGA